MTFKLTKAETVLPADYPIIAGYVYIVDGVFTRATHSQTASEWAARGAKVIRRCDLFAHDGAALGDRV
jgi:hypothetical protein